MLLDDCLSAVDLHTGQWIIDHCIAGDLMRNRTCILITHNVALSMGHARRVIVLSDGKVIAQGSPDAIISLGILRNQQIGFKSNVDTQPSLSTRLYSTGETLSPEHEVEEMTQNAAWEGNETENVNKVEDLGPVPNVTEPFASESKATGAIKWDLYKMYFTASGRWCYWLAMSLIFFVNQFSSFSIDLWIRDWANSYYERKVTTTKMQWEFPRSIGSDIFLLSSDKSSVNFVSLKSDWHSLYEYSTSRAKVNTLCYLKIYAILAMVFMIVKALRMSLLFRGSLSASRNLHNRLLASIMRAIFPFLRFDAIWADGEQVLERRRDY